MIPRAATPCPTFRSCEMGPNAGLGVAAHS